VTLVLQGLTLPAIIRVLGLAELTSTAEEDDARRMMLQAALEHLQRRREEGNADLAEIYDDIAGHYQHQLATLSGEDGHEEASETYLHFLGISRELLSVEREKIINLRDQGRISDEVLRRLETELDLNETRLNLAAMGQADD